MHGFQQRCGVFEAAPDFVGGGVRTVDDLVAEHFDVPHVVRGEELRTGTHGQWDGDAIGLGHQVLHLAHLECEAEVVDWFGEVADCVHVVSDGRVLGLLVVKTSIT